MAIPVELSPPTINIADVIPGDLIFLEHEDSGLDLLIAQLDKSAFAHVGIVVEPGVMASARSHVMNPGADKPDLDLGGVRLNAIADLAYRQPWAARPKPAEFDPSEVLKRVYTWLEIGPRPQPDASEFSFVKLFLIAAGLNAFLTPRTELEGKDAMWADIFDASQVWEAKIGDAHPGFFCSEMIAHAFDKDFTLRQFRPPPSPKKSYLLRPLSIGEELEKLRQWDKIARAALESLPDLADLSASGPRVVELLRAMSSVHRHDREFLKTAIKQLIDFLKTRRGGPAKKPTEPKTPKPPTTPPPPDSKIPPSDYDRNPDVHVPRVLVTPRMIAHVDWHEGLKHIDFSPKPEG